LTTSSGKKLERQRVGEFFSLPKQNKLSFCSKAVAHSKVFDLNPLPSAYKSNEMSIVQLKSIIKGHTQDVE